MRKWVDMNEDWPVYRLVDYDLPPDQYAYVDFTDEQLAEYDRIMDEFQELQGYLGALTEANDQRSRAARLRSEIEGIEDEARGTADLEKARALHARRGVLYDELEALSP